MKRITTVAIIAIVAGLTLSGCGDTATDADTHLTNSPSDTTKGSGRKGG